MHEITPATPSGPASTLVARRVSHLPSQVYNTYCSAEDPVTLVHSNWSAIGRTYQTARTE